MVNRATIFCVCFHLFLPTHLRVHCSSPWFCVVPFYLLIYSFVMCFCTSLVISNIDIWSVPKMSRNEASFTICRPSFGSCKLLALMYTHNALVISGRVISPVMFNVLANVVDNCTFCVIIAGFFWAGTKFLSKKLKRTRRKRRKRGMGEVEKTLWQGQPLMFGQSF